MLNKTYPVLVGYLTGEYIDGYLVFLSIEKLKDYEINVAYMTPVYILL